MKKILVYALAVVMAFGVFTACGKKGGEVETPPSDPELWPGYFAVPEYEDDVTMLIGGFWAPTRHLSGSNWRDPDPAAFQDAADMGLTMLIPTIQQLDFGVSHTLGMNYLNKAYDAGLKVLVSDGGIGACHRYTDLNAWMNVWNLSSAREYTQHPAFAGQHFFDEPHYYEFDVMAEKQRMWKEEFGDSALFMINLLPDCDTLNGSKIPKVSWKNYVGDFIKNVKPEVLSYDFYPLDKNGGVDLFYYKDAAFIRQAAKDAGIPAWAYLLTAGHLNHKYNLTKEDLRYQMNMYMAYGYQSLNHFAIDVGDDPTYEQFITPAGQRTEQWYNIQTVNREVLKWDHVYLRFNWEATAPIYANTIMDDNVTFMLNLIEDGRVEADEIEGIKSVISDECALLGIFKDDDGNKGFMLSNATNPNHGKTATVTLKFETPAKGKRGYTGVQVYEKGEPRIALLDKDGGITIELESGEGKFLIPLMKK